MRLDLLYVLGSLWGGPPSSPVCTASPAPGPKPVREATWVSGSLALRPDTLTGVTAFIDVNIVPMDQERVLPHQTVVVEGGRITALGPANQIKVPFGAVRVDGRGKYLMPGLADMHYGPYHQLYPMPEGQDRAFADLFFVRYVAHGVTTIRSLGKSTDSEVEQFRRIFAEFPVPRLYLALRLPKMARSSPDSMAATLAAIKAAGYSHVLGDITADSLTMAALRRAGLPMVTHSHPMSFANALKVGVSGGSVEHLYAFWDSLLGRPGPGATGGLDTLAPVELPMAKVPTLVTAMQRAGVWVTPSLICMETVHPYITGNGLAQLVKAMQDGGVKMLLGSDGWAVSQWSVHGELVAMTRAGLTPYQALLTGTRNVAEYFHLLDSAGTVAVGKRADLVLLSGNPLENVRHTWTPAGVMIAGRWFDRVALDQRQLASPRFWFQELLSPHIPPDGDALSLPKQVMRDMISAALSKPRSNEQWDELERRGQRVYALADSLDPTTRQTNERVVRLITAELGPIRAILAPEQHEEFDLKVHVWLREQARQGYAVKVPGVAPVP